MKKLKPEARPDIKKRCQKTFHTLTELSLATHIPYNTLMGYLDGRSAMKPKAEETISKQLGKWELNEQNS